jgi:hypothetical protein
VVFLALLVLLTLLATFDRGISPFFGADRGLGCVFFDRPPGLFAALNVALR